MIVCAQLLSATWAFFRFTTNVFWEIAREHEHRFLLKVKWPFCVFTWITLCVFFQSLLFLITSSHLSWFWFCISVSPTASNTVLSVHFFNDEEEQGSSTRSCCSYHPISLANVDFKHLSKLLALHLKTMLLTVISLNQICKPKKTQNSHSLFLFLKTNV